VSTTNDALASVAAAAAEAGKHVLVEKPVGRTVAEVQAVATAARSSGVHVQPGFTLRFHPALRRMRDLVDADAVGDLMFLRARYGHGGRVGYDREWRADPAVSGGGELIDQGVHLIDLTRWFLGDVTAVDGQLGTFYWDMPVDDNAFLILRTATRRVAWLHASCSEWKNIFSLELYGRGGKLQVDGLGGSYGVERLSYYRMLPEMGPPETTMWENPGPDGSWQAEFNSFVDAAMGAREPVVRMDDAIEVMRVVERAYRSLPVERVR
jgi:predicted dehydrogenase